MRLSEWLEHSGTTQDAFGIKIGVTQGRVSQIVRNGTRDFLMIQRIHRATNKKVLPEDLLPHGALAAMAGGDVA